MLVNLLVIYVSKYVSEFFSFLVLVNFIYLLVLYVSEFVSFSEFIC